MEEAFEARWANRESKLRECNGFVAFSMLRRDLGDSGGHGNGPLEAGEVNYVSCTIWKDRAAFEAWRSGSAFSAAHSQHEKPASSDNDDPKASKGGVNPKQGRAREPTMWARPPSPSFFEGKLVLSCPDGA